MLKIAWATDVHLNFKSGNTDFYNSVVASRPDAVLITGDIAEAKDVAQYVMEMDDKFGVPIYFVLGNHDYYGGSLVDVRAEMSSLTATYDNLFWLPEAGPVSLSESVAICGVDGWYDGRYGRSDPPKLIMNDWRIIKELREHSAVHSLLLAKLRELAEAEAALAAVQLEEAAETHDTVYFLTHVPPWIEAAWHMHDFSDDVWRPWFTSKAIGDALEAAAEAHPHVNFEVLCGHTHSSGELLVRHNLRCRTGRAKYSEPSIADMICIKTA